jgi:hypothetical protein
MTHQIRAAAALLATLLVATAFAEDQSRSPQGRDFGSPRMIVKAPSDVRIRHLSWPKVIRAQDGTIVTAFIAGEFHGTHGGGCPAVAISVDGGKSFTPPKILKQYGPGQTYTSAGNCALGLAPDGAVVLLSMAYNGDVASTIDAWRSEDNGRTWKNADASALSDNKSGSVFGEVIEVPGKGMAAFGHYRPPHKRAGGIWMAWSVDEGRSWQSPTEIARVADRLVEPAFTYSDGRLVGLVKSGRDYYYQFVSDDLGKTWTSKEKGLAYSGNRTVKLPSPCIVSDPEHPGRLLAFVSERHEGSDSNELRGRITLWTAEASKLAWQELGEVVLFPKHGGNDFTYPWMTSLGNDQWYVVFYAGDTHGPSNIYGMTVSLPPR